MNRKRIFSILKWLFLCTLLAVLGLAFLSYRWWRNSHRVPKWYSQATQKTDSPRAANDLMQTMGGLQSWASRATAGPETSRPVNLKTYTTRITEDQLNAWWSNWAQAVGLDDALSSYLADMRVHLADGRITVGGYSREIDKILSIELLPVPGNPGTHIELGHLRVGESIVPFMAIASQQKRFEKLLLAPIPKWRKKLAIDARGVVSSATENTYFSLLVMHLFRSESPELFLFLGEGTNVDKRIVMRVKKIDIAEGNLDITFENLSPEERAALLEALKHEVDELDKDKTTTTQKR